MEATREGNGLGWGGLVADDGGGGGCRPRCPPEWPPCRRPVGWLRGAGERNGWLLVESLEVPAATDSNAPVRRTIRVVAFWGGGGSRP